MPSRPSLLPPFSPKLTLATASDEYLRRRKLHLRPRSLEQYQYHFRTLHRFLDPQRRLSSFHEGDFRDYQKWRNAAGIGPSLINHELGALSQVLSLAKLWHPISKYYERLPEGNWAPPKVLSAEEEERFFRFAARHPECRTACNVALITNNTTLAGCELRTLRLEDICLNRNPPLIQVPDTVKNRHRVRAVPLNHVAIQAVEALVAQAKARGATEAGHYLIPFRVKRGVYDCTRPASPYFIRASFRKIAQACDLQWVTPRLFRHQAITKLLETGAPDETVRAIAGHVSEKAMRYYSHIRIEAKKSAVDRLHAVPVRPQPVNKVKGKNAFPLLRGLRQTANRLGISHDIALELVLSYEQSKRVVE